jgi:hypothetical protein
VPAVVQVLIDQPGIAEAALSCLKVIDDEPQHRGGV